MSLGGILLCITGMNKYSNCILLLHVLQMLCLSLMLLFLFSGSEAMFADLGHFSQLSIKVQLRPFVYDFDAHNYEAMLKGI